MNTGWKNAAAIAALVTGVAAVSAFWISHRASRAGIPAAGNPAAMATSSVGAAPTDTVVFAVEADPHMDAQSDEVVYRRTLGNIVAAKPDFVVDLGDIFMIDKLSDKSEAGIRARYALFGEFYGLLGGIPLHFAMGNHDGETGWDAFDAKPYRREYFPDSTGEKNYYSFERGGALFVILDPYTYTAKKPNADGWGWTLGKEQYDWLKTTLEESRAKRKFVFIHQLVGGDAQGRGGVEMANLYEWGGGNVDGTYGFDARRPGWGEPIARLLADNGVDIVFKGHDHVYVRQELGGVVYQTVPQPGHPGDGSGVAGEYGYASGKTAGGSGFLDVRVSDGGVSVRFVKADGSVGDDYRL